MARPIDPERHEARRLEILDAALTCFAERGFEGTSTTRICAQAGIGSGTLFHYFPTKRAVVLALLALGRGRGVAFLAAQRGRTDAFGVVLDYVQHAGTEVADPRAAGFARMVAARLHDDEVATALAAEAADVRASLVGWLDRARAAGEIRADWAPDRAAVWVESIVDCFVGAVARGDLAATDVPGVRDVVRRVLAP